MIPEFDRLSSSEVELLLKAPILTCILIAGADGDIDRNEIKKAIEMTEKSLKKSKTRLSSYYNIISEDFEDKLKILIQSFPIETTQRTPLLIEELAGLNTIFHRMDRTFSIELYKSLKDIALKVAESSGGLLGIKSIGEEEARLVNLPMIKDPSL